MGTTTNIDLTGDTLKNILLMAPMLDEAGQNKVFGLICGLISSVKQDPDEKKPKS
jgi:hypothetical protein